MGRTRPPANMRTFLTLCLATSALAQNRLERGEIVEVVKPQEEPSFFARIVGDEGTARIVESISSWVNDKAKENPGCVEHFVCEMYKTGETMSGLPYLVMSLTNAAVSFMVAEQFSDSIQMDAITRASKYGRTLTGWLGLRSCWVTSSTRCQHLSARAMT